MTILIELDFSMKMRLLNSYPELYFNYYFRAILLFNIIINYVKTQLYAFTEFTPIIITSQIHEYDT